MRADIGKGDRRTRRGKIYWKSYCKRRPKKKKLRQKKESAK